MEAQKTKQQDAWDLVNYPELDSHQNEIIRIARRLGFADFFPSVPSAQAQAENTYAAAKKFLQQ